MASSQQAMVVDLIEAVKRKRKIQEINQPATIASPSQPIFTNRGNKLFRNAEYVQKGKLSIPSSVASHTQVINFNGYRRSIVSLKPPKYDNDGDLVEDEDELEDDNLSSAEEDIYKDTKLEEIFMPLTAASDLPTHPSMAAPYHDKGLPQMIRNVEEDLHRQLETLWKLKAIWTQLRGDAAWAPVENFHDGFDDWLLGAPGASVMPVTSIVKDYGASAAVGGDPEQVRDSRETAGSNNAAADASSRDGLAAPTHAQLTDAKGTAPISNGELNAATNSLLNQRPERADTTNQTASIALNTNGEAQSSGGGQAAPATTNGNSTYVERVPPHAPPTGGNQDEPDQGKASPTAQDTNSQPQSHRMTTRAQAHRGSRSPSHSRSDSAPSSILPIHPMFQYPITAITDESAGLPPQLADESRACLLQYVSKQEEVIRQQTQLLERLKKALEMRKNVFRWCKAEGHVGEMSDGEDWYDKEEWNLDADLIKGREEEEDEDRGGKTRRRGRGEKPN